MYIIRDYYIFLKKFLFPRNKFLIVITFFLTIISGLLSGVGLALYIPVINYFVGNDKNSNFFNVLSNKVITLLHLHNNFLTVISLATATIVIGAFLTYVTMLSSGYLSIKGYRSVKMRLINDLLDRPYHYFIQQRIGKIVSIITDQATLASNTTAVMFRYLTDLFLGLVYFASLFAISHYLTFAMFLLGGFMLFMNRFFSRRRERLSSKWMNIKHEQSNLFTETLIGIKTIKSMGLEHFRKKEVESSLDNEKKTIFTTHINYHTQPLVAKILTTFFASLSIWLSMRVFHLPGGEIIVFLMVAARLSSTMQELNGEWMELAQNMPNIKIVMQYINWDDSAKAQKTKQKFSLENSIVLKDVSFAYNEHNYVLKNINMEILKNQFIALIGPSGEGKTTLLDLIIGLYLPTQGRVLYDGMPLECYFQEDWCKSIGVVTQDAFLFNESIAKNISYGDKNPDQGLIEEVARIAFAHDFIKGFKDGYGTIIGDRGVILSGGQRQRIVLARALYHRPKLLILDEATSNLDSESERCIQQSLEQMHGNLTIIAVAHRLSTIRNADIIYCVINGVIEEKGSHGELIASETYYRKQSLMQAT